MAFADHLLTARTFLFVPGHRPDRFDKAHASGADVVVLDLEDAVAPQHKDEARRHVTAWLHAGHRAVVRVNGTTSPWLDDDLAAVGRLAGALILPKAQSALDIGRLPSGVPVLPLVETALGVLHSREICSTSAVVRPVFGSVDLATELTVDHTSHQALRHARSALVLATAAARCGAPVDGVTTALDDEHALTEDTAHARSLGFTGKLCIHPRQVPVVHRVLAPTEDQIQWARAVLAIGAQGSVVAHAGQMIDRPVLLRAQALLHRAEFL
ncbi:CoA ester lyase [Streptomyces sp. VNUA24]|uniref:HpcH/HpaI aldolase/citrate lyase family protein n=1 Tax=Streptomyces sp. VNUA24 TaxID=3031131 RepID=UPI0023B7D795|nr:CoA ester lyase [Streptomyces sp. VNUA24]WEH19692.1 CoA ester lyase [Streptomyces sp. VNUA24]